jgi:hypothetical protein
LRAGTRRNGSSKFGLFTRTAPGHRGSPGHRTGPIAAGHGHDAYAPDDEDVTFEPTAVWNADDAYYGAAYDDDAGYDEGALYREDAGYGADASYYEDATYDGHAAYDRGASQEATVAWDATEAWDADANPADDADTRARRRARYAGRHASSRRKTARIRARQAVPAAVVAAAFAAGAVAYTLAGSSHPQAAQLNDAMYAPLILSAAAHAGRADTAASAMIQATQSPGAGRSSVSASRAASPKPSASRAGAAKSDASPAATASATAAASPAASASSSPTASTLSCNLSYGLLPDNVTAIVSFLLANGYTDNAAAGIAGNIYQESKGDPESIGMGGGGLIGWTPLPSGFVTGDPDADLQTQLAAVLTYNQQWSSYLPALNSAANPADAAYIYVTYFERAGIPAASTREAAAENVASACGI